MSFIEIASICKAFGDASARRHVLEEVSLSVEPGEFVAIVGFMGCGKSTLLNIIAGLQLPDSGCVRFDGEPARGMRRDASIVFQNYALLPWFTALENVRLAVAAAFPEWSRDRHTDQARRYLAKVGLANALHRRPSQLSGGMRQRVAIARAFATEPAILLLDEPFGALDALTRANLQQELVQLCSASERPATTIMITNNLDEALLLADRIVPMTRGPRARLGTPVPVLMARPRSAAHLMHDEQAVQARSRVVEALTASLEGSRANRRRRASMDRTVVDAPLAALARRSEA